MSAKQAELLKSVLAAHLAHDLDPAYAAGVEVGHIAGVDPRTARSLEAAGLIYTVCVSPESGQTHAYLDRRGILEAAGLARLLPHLGDG